MQKLNDEQLENRMYATLKHRVKVLEEQNNCIKEYADEIDVSNLKLFKEKEKLLDKVKVLEEQKGSDQLLELCSSISNTVKTLEKRVEVLAQHKQTLLEVLEGIKVDITPFTK